MFHSSMDHKVDLVMEMEMEDSVGAEEDDGGEEVTVTMNGRR